MLSAKLKTGGIKLYPSLPPPAPSSDWHVQSSWQPREPLPPEESAASATGSSAQNPHSSADYLIKSVPQFPHLQSGYDLSLLHAVGTETCTALDRMSKHVSRQRTSRLCISQIMLLNFLHGRAKASGIAYIQVLSIPETLV